VTDAAVLSAQTDGVVLVVNANSTTKNQLKQSYEELEGLNKQAGLIGIVLNDISAKRDGYYYNYYYRSYYREDDQDHSVEGGNGRKGRKKGNLIKNPFGNRKNSKKGEGAHVD
jgi:Mrp family chromosome partitioning ATPase